MNPKPKCFVQLGRAGDVLNMLPLVQRESKRIGAPVPLVIQKDFARLLESVSYAVPVPFDGRFEDVIGGCAFASGRFPDHAIVCTQIYGEFISTAEACSGFCRESWSLVPGAPAWGSRPLVFDRRDAIREGAVCAQLRRTAKPYYVLALEGTSSPFPRESASAVRAAAKQAAAGTHEVIDLAGFHTDRFQDLLGLLEGASVIISIDSGVLHLAAAVPQVPVVAIITRDPDRWHGSSWRPSHKLRLFYDELPNAADLIRLRLPTLDRDERGLKIIHTWTHYQPGEIEPETARRMEFARQTWRAEYTAAGNWLSFEFKKNQATRDSGGPRPVPYVRDMIVRAIEATDARPGDVIALTNADVCFTPGLTGWICDKVARVGACYTHRYDFNSRALATPLANEAQVQIGRWYPGSDAFFFTVEWWKTKGCREYPDMLIGREQCDEILRMTMKRTGGVELQPGAIYHEKHPSFWDANRESDPGNIHNRRLAAEWLRRRELAPNDWMWWKPPGSSGPGEELG